jgi:hypothetical protein
VTCVGHHACILNHEEHEGNSECRRPAVVTVVTFVSFAFSVFFVPFVLFVVQDLR